MKMRFNYARTLRPLEKLFVQNLKALLEKLLESRIDFVLVGGFAGVLHGSTMVTQDIDICAAITQDTLDSLRTALIDLHPKLRMNPNFKPSFFDQPKSPDGVENIYLETDLGILDVMSKLPPVGDFELIKSRAITFEIYGYSCRVIALEDLIRIKESMKRPKDKQIVHELRILQEKLKN